MNYSQTVSYLESFIDYEKRALPAAKDPFRLDRVRELLGFLGDPQDSFRSIHVAGTNGKGSTAAMAASILEKAGFKTGLYTSPHLVSFSERIRINGRPISKQALCRVVEQVREAAGRLESAGKRPSFFEVYTAVCFAFFSSRKVDFAVVEVGLGGRLDATNVITPEVSVITTIAVDHVKELGSDPAGIAAEKCGIIKPGVPAVTCRQEKAVLRVIKEKTAAMGARLTVVTDRPEDERGSCPGCEIIALRVKSCSESGSVFDLASREWAMRGLSVRLLGAHQAANAGMAAAAAGVMGVPENFIRKGLEAAALTGRLQLIPAEIPVLLDGGHNPSAAKALAGTLKTFFKDRDIVLVFGVSSDKDFTGIAAELIPLAESVIFTRSANPRAADPRLLEKRLSLPGIRAAAAENTTEAINMAHEKSGPNTLICVAGSFYLVGEALDYLRRKGAPMVKSP